MRKLICGLAVMLVLTVVLVGCSGGVEQSVINPETTQVSYDMSTVITVGNRSYIPINSGGNPSDNPSSILLILKAFEDVHPELEIVGWEIEKQQKARFTSAKIFGIWVEHKLKD